ncbi:MAG: amino acid permease, partial [Armatimonadota bacterium]|nr:amino acid permease [Armatimonadota bacterium]
MLRARALPATLWRALVGSPLETQRLRHERLTKVKGLAVFGADALSSSAYATEEILRVLVLAGVGAVALTVPVSLAIVALMAIVAISYYQTIHAYPSGGGAYIVAHENLGLLPGLVAAAALLVDYILTVAVSISAGVAAITSALPELYPHRVELALGFIALITVANLRGVRESGTIFAIP